MERLSAEDRLMLWPDEIWPQDIGALAVLDGSALRDPDGRFRIEAVRHAIAGRLHLLPRFRQVLYQPRRGLGGPLWVDARGFDLCDHIGVVALPRPGDEARLLETVERLRRRRLDRSRPLWEMWFLPGMPNGRVGLFIRMHHVVADGMAGVATLGRLLDPVPDAVPTPALPWTPAPWPPAGALLADNLRGRLDRLGRACRAMLRPVAALRRAIAAWPAIRELLAEEPGPATGFNRVIGPDRTLALVRTSLGEVSEVAHAHGATVNDVLLALTAAGVRGLLRRRGEPVDLALPVYVPVSLRKGRPGRDAGNLITQMVVRLPIGLADPGQRLRRIAAETTRLKGLARPSLGVLFHGRILSGLMLKRIARRRVNCTSADLPGPRQPLYLAGAQVLEVFPLLNLIGNVSLGVGALSYAGQFGVLTVADRDTFPDLDVFAAAVRDELCALAAATSTTGFAEAPALGLEGH